MKGPFIFASIMQSAAERHMNRNEIENIDCSFGLLLQRLDIFVGQYARLDVREPPPGFTSVGLPSDDCPEDLYGLVGLSGEAEAYGRSMIQWFDWHLGSAVTRSCTIKDFGFGPVCRECWLG